MGGGFQLGIHLMLFIPPAGGGLPSRVPIGTVFRRFFHAVCGSSVSVCEHFRLRIEWATSEPLTLLCYHVITPRSFWLSLSVVVNVVRSSIGFWHVEVRAGIRFRLYVYTLTICESPSEVGTAKVSLFLKKDSFWKNYTKRSHGQCCVGLALPNGFLSGRTFLELSK